MVINATGTPLEVLLTIQAFDIDGKEITRLVYLDTNDMTGKQLLVVDGKTEFKPVQVGDYHFSAATPDVEEMLRDFLPLELHNRISQISSGD